MGKSKWGIFISFEGTEGSGKSTLMRHLALALEKEGLNVISTREPGGNPVSEQIREVVLKNAMDPWTEILLYEASRAENIAKSILPALKKGTIVLCDRFTASSLAYQAHARGLPWNKIKTLNHLATQGLEPDLTVFLDINPEVGLLRAKDRNRFEEEGVKFQMKVRQGFLKARRENPKKWLTLMIRQQTPEQLTKTVLQRIFLKFRNQLKRKKRGKDKTWLS